MQIIFTTKRCKKMIKIVDRRHCDLLGDFVECVIPEAEFHPRENCIEIASEQWVLKEYANQVGICSECGNVEFFDDMERVFDEDGIWEYVCDRCVRDDNGIHYCGDCGEYFTSSAFDFEAERCIDCAERWREESEFEMYNSINSYDFKPIPEFKKNPAEKTRRYYGLEIEVSIGGAGEYISDDFLNKANQKDKYCYLKYDSSIDDNGFEIVTHPMSRRVVDEWLHTDFYEGINALRESANVTNKGCGVHIHINRSAVGELTYAKLFLLLNLTKGESNWKFLQAITNRTYDNLRRWANPDNVFQSSTPWSKHLDKYYALNTCHENTLEFRIFKGSTDPDMIMSYLDFVDSVVTFCANTPINKISWGEYIEYFKLNKYKYPYLNKRLFKKVKDTITGETKFVCTLSKCSIPTKISSYDSLTYDFSGCLNYSKVNQMTYLFDCDTPFWIRNLLSAYSNYSNYYPIDIRKKISDLIDDLFFKTNKPFRQVVKEISNDTDMQTVFDSLLSEMQESKMDTPIAGKESDYRKRFKLRTIKAKV